MPYDTELPRPFVRSRDRRMLAGVCGAVAEYFDIDVNIVRVATLAAAFASFGTVALIYLAAWMLVPEA
ncbi:PspC domain-containing protein [Rhodococcus spongiicola]|uniref:PspC domain-containing protein n=1 Tax=Rhodococcus spongiicola TaxID=2487352 RepID=A0A3S3DY48_9NOCA|nr:PspC domain-containing protein [Rhodococcus spongiicola]RVW01633.1 PspC domain-containing protein [Rhodococcus spongiicola]